jgi:hypothetical protein
MRLGLTNLDQQNGISFQLAHAPNFGPYGLMQEGKRELEGVH